jgi:hypothetical protein
MKRRIALVTHIAGIALALALFLPSTARADYVSDAEAAIDASGALPFSISDWDPILRSCASSNDLVDCAEAVAVKEGLDPENAAQAASVYEDIIQKDYTGLISDAGVAIACAASELSSASTRATLSSRWARSWGTPSRRRQTPLSAEASPAFIATTEASLGAS